jgi:menaquinol-cytochrome c reductase iron-sulfur subunit
MTSPKQPVASSKEQPAANSRRSFFTKLAAGAIGALVALVPLAAGLATYFDPLRRRGAGSRLVRVTSIDAIPSDGRPALFRVVMDRVDAWTEYKNEPVGAVYLRRADGKVEAFNAVCPHLGCFVSLGEKRFQCPCHNSAFEFDGQRVDPQSSPSPRNMDSLQVDEAKLVQGEVWVEFRNFIAGKHEKIDAITWEVVG